MKIPPHRGLRRRHLGTALYKNADQKWRRVIERAREVTQAGRPVLVGTRSVAASEEVSARLTTAGLSQHTVLNARQDRTEAEIVAQAGQPSRITVATDMAGRGTFGLVIQRFGGAKQGELLRRRAQYRAERQHARTRLDTMAQDRRLQKQLAFAGSSE